MLLTPPDIISQTLIAVPMWLLFEAGLIFVFCLVRQMLKTLIYFPLIGFG
jgi:sec-independent protein translocase protein TatC